jgi:hypothetical protein
VRSTGFYLKVTLKRNYPCRASIINLTISAILCFATQPNFSIALLGFPRLTAISVGRHKPRSLTSDSRQSNPTNRNAISINKALLITLPRRNLYSHPTAPVAASDTSPPHSPQPNPNPAEYQYSPNTTYPASLPQSAPHWPLLRHKSLRS